MSCPLRVGIVGANATRGWAKDAHLAATNALPGLELVAVSARTQEDADLARIAFGAARGWGDSLALARDPEVDLVVVTVKVPEHRAVVLAALRAGKHVYCEWPLGRDVAEAEEMARSVGEGQTAMVGLQALSSPAVRQAADLVRSGALGVLKTLRVVSPTAGWAAHAPPVYAYLQDRTSGASFEAIAGGHTLALVEAIVGPYREVDARSTTFHPEVGITGSEETVRRTCADHMTVVGLHDGGCVSTTEIVSGAPTLPFVFELVGTWGALALTGGGPGGYQTGRLALSSTVADETAVEDAGFSLEGPPLSLVHAYDRLLSDLGGGTRTRPDFDDAARLTRLLDRIEIASRTGVRQILEP